METISAGIADAVLFVPAHLALFVLQLADYLVWLSGAILNYVIQYSVVDMKTNLDKANSINNAWKLVRDICNMAFIFVLLYAAIQQILGIGKDVKGLIVRVVVVAVLINFSLFFTKFVIDISNIFALMFYDAIAPGALSKTVSGGLSNTLMEPLQLQTVYKSVEGGVLNGRKLFITGVMGTILSLIAAFTFFAVAIMFIIRFVVLMFVLVLSPIAFIASILPEAEKYKSQWFDALLGQAFFAPIYFMLTWVVIVISRGVLTNGGNIATVINGITGPNGEAVPPDPSAVGVLVNFLILIALMISSLTIAKEWANKAGPGMGKLTSWATGMAGSATLGMTGRFGRGTIGRVGQQVADSEYLKSKPDSMMARLALATGRKTAGASFDARSAGWADQLGAGKGQSGGFAKDIKNKMDAEKKYADEFKPSDLVVANAEKEFEAIKKTGTIYEVTEAQKKLDKLKGASAEDIKNRKIKEMVASGEANGKKDAKNKLDILENRRLRRMNELRASGLTEEAAKEQIKTEGEDVAGWEAEAVKSAANTRKETYAKDRESGVTEIPVIGAKIPHFDISGRVFGVGPIKKERQAIANAIRKSIKEKKAAEKIAEEIGKQAADAADDAGGGAPSTPTAPAPAGPTP